jgi:hypothetical protein
VTSSLKRFAECGLGVLEIKVAGVSSTPLIAFLVKTNEGM